MELCTCYVTCASKEEALAIGRAVVDRRLAACANVVDGVTSIYRWQGTVHTDPEALLFLKTRRDLVGALVKAVVALHSYDCPAVTVLPIVDGHPDYLEWVIEQTSPEPAD
ncbi:Divalent-cation tolerance protein CutA [bacterium HR40]|nr:Divalent-cation tolerance protein CutA [bacterium HR40]